MINAFAGWLIMAGIAICLAVAVWLAAAEYHEDKFNQRNAQMSKAQRRRAVQDAREREENENWRNVS